MYFQLIIDVLLILKGVTNTMPVHTCPLGSRCHDGEDGAPFKSAADTFEEARMLILDHVKFAHPTTPVQHDPVIKPGDNANINVTNNLGTMGGNFVNSNLKDTVFNIHHPEDKYFKLEVLGSGSFGVTWIAKHKSGKDKFAMKEIHFSEPNFKTAKNEIELLKKIPHKNIVSYIEDYNKDNSLFIIMEFCSGGNLAEFINAVKMKKLQLLPIDFILTWIIQITTGLCFIHKKNIIHRDLKPANILLTSEAKKTLKIGDFGQAKGLKTNCFTRSKNDGTLLYVAPEILKNVNDQTKVDDYNTMADMWALGVISFEIIALENPFRGYDFYTKICKGFALNNEFE